MNSMNINHTEKLPLKKEEKRKRIIDLFTDCGGNTPGVTMVAPLKMPIQWSKVLRIGSGSKINVDEFLSVCSTFIL